MSATLFKTGSDIEHQDFRRIAACQMNSTADKAHNLDQAHGLLLEAVNRGADLVSFPETFSALCPTRTLQQAAAETLRGPTVETLREWAVEHNVWIHGGSLLLKTKGEKLTNTTLLFDPYGEIVARYDKIHLFNAKLSQDKTSYEESKTIQAGKKVVTADLPCGPVGLSICFDLRFPELYRKQAAQGVNVIFIPAAFTSVTGKAHWDVLTRARAIENQCYVVAAAQVGSPYEGRETHGHTRIIDPWGRVIAERSKGVGIVMAELEYGEMARIRAELPSR